MSKEKNRGMWLCQTADSGKTGSHWLLQGLVTMLSSMVLAQTAAAFAGFDAGNAVLVMAAASAGCGLFYTVFLKYKQEHWFVILLLVCALAGILLCRRQMLEGFRICWNQAGDTLVRRTGWVLPPLQLAGLDGDHCAAVFASAISAGSFLLCAAMIRFAPKIFACVLLAFVVFGMMLLQVRADFAWLLPMLFMGVATFLYGMWQRKTALSVLRFSWGICAVAVIALLSVLSLTVVQTWADATSYWVREKLHAEKYETSYHTLPEGDFTGFEVVEREAEPALVVTMEVPHAMYLRGFTGAALEGNRWVALERDVIADDQTLLYWLNTQSFDLHAQFDAAAGFAQLPQGTVTVQNLGACSFYCYAPFSIVAGEWEQPENLNADGIHADGQRDYRYSAWVGTGENILQVLTLLQTSEDEAVRSYRKAESAYRQYVYEQYLQVPEEVKELLQEAWDRAASKFEKPTTRQQSQESALIFLAQCFPEEGTPDDLQLPLSVAEGTVYQYVTVTVMTLRYFGIPARYAEGYVITDEMVSGLENGATVTVDSSCATAWVEIYQDGIGWIPMDLAPGMSQRQEPSEDEEPKEDPNSPNEDKKEEPEEQDPEPQEQPEPEPIGGTLVRIFTNLLRVIVPVILGIFFAAIILILRRKWVLKRKWSRFESENCKDAVAWIYSDMASLLEKLGFHRGNGSMRQLCVGLEASFGPAFGEQFAVATDLNDRAMFSSRPMRAEQRETARKCHSAVVQMLHTSSKWYKRLWLRWILCLY